MFLLCIPALKAFSNTLPEPDSLYCYMPEIAATVEDTACVNNPDSTAVVASALAVSEPVNITCPELLIIPDPTICGQSTGLIDLTVTPADNYTYLWSNNATTEDISNLPAGLYIVTVTDANGCSATASATVTVYWSGFSLFGITIDPDAGQNNGAIDLIVSPAGTYTYNWSNGATTEDLSNLGEGAYTVTVTTPAGCTEIATFFLENVCDLFTTYTITPANYCPGQQVTLTLNPTGGTQPYTYLWNNGATTQSITFTATNVISTDGAVTDANGCLAQVFIHIKSSIWQVFIVPSPATCGQDDGHVELTVPGSGNMTFNWSNGSTNEDLFDVAPGPYTVTITGEDGCTTTASTTVTSINTNLSIAGLVTPNSGCGAPNGSVDINVDPAGSYTYKLVERQHRCRPVQHPRWYLYRHGICGEQLLGYRQFCCPQQQFAACTLNHCYGKHLRAKQRRHKPDGQSSG